MKNNLLLSIFALLALALFPGCEVIGGIFKAGAWTGAVLVIAVIALIIFGVSRMMKK